MSFFVPTWQSYYLFRFFLRFLPFSGSFASINLYVVAVQPVLRMTVSLLVLAAFAAVILTLPILTIRLNLLTLSKKVATLWYQNLNV